MGNPTSGAKKRILVIDDNENIHRDFRKILSTLQLRDEHLEKLESVIFGTSSNPEPFALEIDSALQGESGSEMVLNAARAGRPYAIAFVDMRMPPGWDGALTTEKLWQTDRDLFVVICTAYAEQTIDELKKRLGTAAEKLVILKKPFDPEQVIQIVKSQFKREAETIQDTAGKEMND